MIPPSASPKEILDYRHAQWSALEGMEIIAWRINPPASPTLMDWAFSHSTRLKEHLALIDFYREMNGCTIIWNYDHNGIRHEGHLQIFPILELAETDFAEEYYFGVEEDEIPGLSRIGQSAYFLSQNDSDTFIDFGQTPPEILFFVQRGDIEAIPLPLEEWLRMTLLTVGDKGFWPAYQWAKQDGVGRVEELGLEGWKILYPELGELLL